MTREDLLDPATCGRCHEDHYREWSGSMHAYAAEDPVFVAFNRRLQRETNGALGDFCVKCHAPMAVIDKQTTDGTNLAELPAKYRGVTCFFCHTAESVGALHNNGLALSESPVMRGPFEDPVRNEAHRSTRSELHDQTALSSASMCGSCHDIVTPAGAHIERTFAEWQQSLFATETGQTCGQCHMKATDGLRPVANVPGVFARQAHSHTFAGVDRALTPWPNMDEQKREIQDLLDASIQSSLCVSRRGASAEMRAIVDNVFSGHSFPSGASADRRVWIEIIAKRQGRVVFESGVVPPGEPVHEGTHDPSLSLFRDKVFTPDGKETHLFGLASCYSSSILPFPVTANPADPRFYQRNIERSYPADGSLIEAPDEVSMRVRILPVGLEVLDDLIASGDLAPDVRDRMEPMDVGPLLVWTPEAAAGKVYVERGSGSVFECVTLTNQTFAADKFPLEETNTCR